MKENIITYSAQNYAQALFESGSDFEKDLSLVAEVLSTSADFNSIISNPSIDLETKNTILDEIFANHISPNVLQFIKILTEKGRLNEFEGIQAAYLEKVNNSKNIKPVEITSAIELNDDTKNKIVEKLNQKLNKQIIVNWVVNPEIISGLLFKIGDDIVDATLLSKVENIGKNIR